MAKNESMTPDQEAHLKRIKENFDTLVDLKYRKGQREHGGDLSSKSALDLLDEAINEAVDQIVYLETVREIIVGERDE
jgi:hypothetical protein